MHEFQPRKSWWKFRHVYADIVRNEVKSEIGKRSRLSAETDIQFNTQTAKRSLDDMGFTFDDFVINRNVLFSNAPYRQFKEWKSFRNNYFFSWDGKLCVSYYLYWYDVCNYLLENDFEYILLRFVFRNLWSIWIVRDVLSMGFCSEFAPFARFLRID